MNQAPDNMMGALNLNSVPAPRPGDDNYLFQDTSDPYYKLLKYVDTLHDQKRGIISTGVGETDLKKEGINAQSWAEQAASELYKSLENRGILSQLSIGNLEQFYQYLGLKNHSKIEDKTFNAFKDIQALDKAEFNGRLVKTLTNENDYHTCLVVDDVTRGTIIKKIYDFFSKKNGIRKDGGGKLYLVRDTDSIGLHKLPNFVELFQVSRVLVNNIDSASSLSTSEPDPSEPDSFVLTTTTLGFELTVRTPHLSDRSLYNVTSSLPSPGPIQFCENAVNFTQSCISNNAVCQAIYNMTGQALRGGDERGVFYSANYSEKNQKFAGGTWDFSSLMGIPGVKDDEKNKRIYNILIDLKRSGDWSQAKYCANYDCILVTIDRLACLYQIMLGGDCILIGKNGNIDLYLGETSIADKIQKDEFMAFYNDLKRLNDSGDLSPIFIDEDEPGSLRQGLIGDIIKEKIVVFSKLIRSILDDISLDEDTKKENIFTQICNREIISNNKIVIWTVKQRTLYNTFTNNLFTNIKTLLKNIMEYIDKEIPYIEKSLNATSKRTQAKGEGLALVFVKTVFFKIEKIGRVIYDFKADFNNVFYNIFNKSPYSDYKNLKLVNYILTNISKTIPTYGFETVLSFTDKEDQLKQRLLDQIDLNNIDVVMEQYKEFHQIKHKQKRGAKRKITGGFMMLYHPAEGYDMTSLIRYVEELVKVYLVNNNKIVVDPNPDVDEFRQPNTLFKTFLDCSSLYDLLQTYNLLAEAYTYVYYDYKRKIDNILIEYIAVGEHTALNSDQQRKTIGLINPNYHLNQKPQMVKTSVGGNPKTKKTYNKKSNKKLKTKLRKRKYTKKLNSKSKKKKKNKSKNKHKNKSKLKNV